MTTDAATAPLEELRVLEALQETPDISQRELARQIGLSLTKAHFVLKRLMEKGLVKVKNVRNSKHKLGYLYVLTPKGVKEKARLTYAFMQRTAEEYQEMVVRVEGRLERAFSALDLHPELASVAIIGDGPLSEVVRRVLQSNGCREVTLGMHVDLAVLVDPAISCEGLEQRRTVTLVG